MFEFRCRNTTFENNTTNEAIVASFRKPPAHNTPIPASHHNVAAVVRPRIRFFSLSLIMTPAPKKPIPATTCAATREISI